MRRIIAQIRKELTQIMRDKLTLGLALLLPLILLVLMSTGISLTVTNLPMVIVDYDDSVASRSFAAAFRASLSFTVVPWAVDNKPEDALVSNRARAVLIIPPHFGRDMTRGVSTPVQLLVDASDANTAKLASGYANSIVNAYNQTSGASARAAPVQAAIRLWYNPGLDSKKFYGPGIFVLGLSMFPPLLAALGTAKEDEQKTILQVYVSSISVHEFLLGKIFAFVIVALAESMLMLLLLFTYFGLSFAGDPTPFIVATFLYAFCVSSFGVMVGALIDSQVAALQVVMMGGFLLVFLLAGLLFPISNIPLGLRWVSNLVWGRYYIEIVRDAFLQGGGWPAVWYKTLIIGFIGMVFYVLAWRGRHRMQLKV